MMPFVTPARPPSKTEPLRRRLLACALLGLGGVGGCNAILGNDDFVMLDSGVMETSLKEGGFEGSFGDVQAPDAQQDAGFLTDAGGGMDVHADARPMRETSVFDPCLVLPDPHTPSCTINPGATSCPNFGGCLIAYPTGNMGRCQDCEAGGSCAADLNDPCVGPDDCSDLFECYCGQCKNPCNLKLGECSPYCTNVGNDTWGICLSP
jgi:hypothetical protein